ncbi:MAG TPA: cytochrome c biogenesis protein CcsA [Bryobacteraceae bacterium]|nr:cytochrome c biogenesis protein CcsA [Bryobacteraceae bacterium]
MRIIVLLAAFGAAMLVWNLHTILLGLPDEARQDMIFRIIYFHVPGGMLGLTGFCVGLGCSLVYLVKKNLWWDSMAASVTEVALAFALTNLVTGSIWGRQQWGVWWAWDARLTGMLICCLVFSGYLMLRRAVEEPTARARLSAVVSVFGTVNAWFVYKAIDWFPRLQHPGPVLSFRTGGGKMDPVLEHPLYWNALALLCLAIILVMIRMRQEIAAREIDSLRRAAHSY